VLAKLSTPLLAGFVMVGNCILAAEPMVEKPKRVKVTVVTILATDKGNEVDRRLKGIADEIQKMNPQLKGFKLVSMASKSLGVDEKATFPLVEEQTVGVAIRHGADPNNQVGVAVTPPRQGEITFRSTCGKFLPFVTRYQTQGKERLIIAVRVQPCNGK
jgi:hypothetical protein